jgi:hypothetical protein
MSFRRKSVPGEITADEIAEQQRADHEDAILVRGRRPAGGTRAPSRVCVTLVLDSGGLIAIERHERSMWEPRWPWVAR